MQVSLNEQRGRKTQQTWSLSAATAKAFTTVFAGFALTFLISPKISLVQALVAGFLLVLMRQRPGTAKTPVFLTSCAPMAARLSNTAEHWEFFKPCSSAIDLTMALFAMAFAPDFIDFLAFIAFIAFFMAMVLMTRYGGASKQEL